MSFLKSVTVAGNERVGFFLISSSVLQMCMWCGIWLHNNRLLVWCKRWLGKEAELWLEKEL